jgi:hypothetical protein
MRAVLLRIPSRQITAYRLVRMIAIGMLITNALWREDHYTVALK